MPRHAYRYLQCRWSGGSIAHSKLKGLRFEPHHQQYLFIWRSFLWLTSPQQVGFSHNHLIILIIFSLTRTNQYCFLWQSLIYLLSKPETWKLWICCSQPCYTSKVCTIHTTKCFRIHRKWNLDGETTNPSLNLACFSLQYWSTKTFQAKILHNIFKPGYAKLYVFIYPKYFKHWPYLLPIS